VYIFRNANDNDKMQEQDTQADPVSDEDGASWEPEELAEDGDTGEPIEDSVQLTSARSAKWPC